MLVAIIQARMTSTRLPGKVLADICGKPMLQHVIERIRRVERLDDILVATTVNTSDDPVRELCSRLRVKAFRGEEADVLGRYGDAAAYCGAEAVVRLTGDCPMIDPGVIDKAIAMFEEGTWDYVSNCNVRTYPDGLDTEVFTRAALDEAVSEARHPFLREHVTPYIRGTHPQSGRRPFRIGHVTFEADFSHLRWTVDTAEGLERIRRLVAILPENFTWLEALAAATREPDLLGVSERTCARADE